MVFPNAFTIPGFNAALNAVPNGVLGGVATPVGSLQGEVKLKSSETFGYTTDYRFQMRSPALNTDINAGVREMPLLGVGIPPNNLGLKPWLVPVAFAPPQKIPVPYVDGIVGLNVGKLFKGNFNVKGP